MRSRYGRNGRIPQSHRRILKVFDGHIQFVVFLLHCHHKDHSDIGTDGEISRLVTDDKPGKIFFGNINRPVDTGKDIASDTVHFGTELHVQNTVAQVFHHNTAVFEDFFSFTNIVQYDESILSRNFFLFLRFYRIAISSTVLYSIERRISGSNHFLHPVGYIFAMVFAEL